MISTRRGFLSLFGTLTWLPLVFVSPSSAELLAGRNFTRTIGQDFSFSNTYGEFSGITYNPLTQTYFISENRAAVVLEINENGDLLRTINIAGLKNPDPAVTDTDAEGIAWMYGQTYAFTLEKGEEMAIAQITPATTALLRADATIYDLFGDPKGITYSAREDALYWVSETSPKRVVKAQINKTTGNLDILRSVDVDSLAASDLGDIAYFPRLSNNLLLLSPGSKKIMEVNLSGLSPVLASEMLLSAWPIPDAGGLVFGRGARLFLVGKHVSGLPEDDFNVFDASPAIANQTPTAVINLGTQ